jgi:hypothetical protein
MTASQRLRHLNYEARYGGYAETFRRMDRQIEEMQETNARMREVVGRMEHRAG